MKTIELHRASLDDSSGESEYRELGKVLINPVYFECAWDHLVRVKDFTIRVMETAEEIKQCLTCIE